MIYTGHSTHQCRDFTRCRQVIPTPLMKEASITDVGFDAGLFDSKVTLIFDWYSKKARDLLYNPEMPGTAGVAEAPFVNLASMKNSGIEMEISYRNDVERFWISGQPGLYQKQK